MLSGGGRRWPLPAGWSRCDTTTRTPKNRERSRVTGPECEERTRWNPSTRPLIRKSNNHPATRRDLADHGRNCPRADRNRAGRPTTVAARREASRSAMPAGAIPSIASGARQRRTSRRRDSPRPHRNERRRWSRLPWRDVPVQCSSATGCMLAHASGRISRLSSRPSASID